MNRFACLVLMVLGLVSCDQSANRVSTLWTNVPEIASAVEKFNGSQREWQLLLEYKEDPGALLTTPGPKADLVVARGLTSSSVKQAMVPLDFLFDGGNLAKASFYQRLLEAGTAGDHINLLPVSFDLPVLVYSRKTDPDLPGFALSLEEVKTLSLAFEASPSRLTNRQAFSPLWNSFGTTFLQWTGAGFQEGFPPPLSWDSSGLGAGLKLVKEWPPGVDRSLEFQRKYLQGDVLPALSSGRILFSTSTLATFMNRPVRDRRDLDFRYLETGGRILTTESTVWAGIPSSSVTRGAGERFLTWLFQTATQRTLVSSARVEDDRSFGLAQGLPSLWADTATLLEVYPELAGRLPSADQLAPWPALPPDWTAVKATVLKPWSERSDASESTLRTELERRRTQATGR